MYILILLTLIYAVTAVDVSSNGFTVVLTDYQNGTVSLRNANSTVKSLATGQSTSSNPLTLDNTPTSTAVGTASGSTKTGPDIGTNTQVRNATLNGFSPLRSESNTHDANNFTSSNITIPATTIAPTGFGFEYALRCDELSKSWGSAFFDWDHSVMHDSRYMILVTRTYTETSTLYAEQSVPITTTSCLGTSRELGGQVISLSSTGLWLSSYSITVSDYTRPPYPTPTPECSFHVTDCNSLWDAYDAYTNNIATAPPDDALTLRELSEPLCEQSRSYAYCNKCTVSAHNADVHYWPLVAIGEPCDPDRSFTTATPTIPGQPNTAVVDNMTFTSPTLYLRFDYLHATAPDGKFCGDGMHDVVLGFEPTEISTIRFGYVPTSTNILEYTWDLGSTTEYETLSEYYVSNVYSTLPFDFRDLMGAVPGAAYDAQMWRAYRSALWGLSEPVTDRDYRPYIAVPSKLRDMDPHWSSCELGIHIDDPPVALQMVSTLKKPETPLATTTGTTTTQQSSNTAAEPGSPPKTPQVSPTNTAGSQSPATKPTSRIDPPVDTLPSKDELPETQTLGNAPPSEGDPNDPPKETPGSTSRVASIITGLGPGPRPTTTRARHPTATPMLVTLGGVPVPVKQSGSFAVVGGRTLTMGGSPVAINGQNVRLVSSGIALMSSTTIRFPSATPEARIADRISIPIEGGAIAAAISGSSILLSQREATAALSIGQKITFGGHELAALPSGVGLQMDGDSIWLFDAGMPQTSLTMSGENVTAVQLDENRVLLVSGSETAVVANGNGAKFGNATIVALADGSGVVVIVEDSSVIPFPREEKEDGEFGGFGIYAQMSGRVVITNDGTTMDLRNGEATMIGGHTVSAARDGRHVVVDGSKTESFVLGAPSATGVDEDGDGLGDGTDSMEGAVATAGSLRSRLMFSAWHVSVFMGVSLLVLA